MVFLWLRFAIVLGIGVVFGYGVALYVQLQQSNTINKQHNYISDTLSSALLLEIQLASQDAAAFAGLFEQQRGLHQDSVLETFVKQLSLREHSGYLQAIEWVVRVNGDDERIDFETDHLMNSQYKTITRLSEDYTRVRQDVKETYYPVIATVPITLNDLTFSVHGNDVGAVPRSLDVMEAAISTDRTEASAMVTHLVPGEQCVLFATAVSVNRTAGLTITSIRINEVVMKAVPLSMMSDFSVLIYDQTANGELIFAYDGLTRIPINITDKQVTYSGDVVWRSVTVGSREWRLAIYVTNYLKEKTIRSGLSLLIGLLSGGGMMAILTVMFLSFLYNVRVNRRLHLQLLATFTCAEAIRNMDLDTASEYYKTAIATHKSMSRILLCCADIIDVMKEYRRFLPQVWNWVEEESAIAEDEVGVEEFSFSTTFRSRNISRALSDALSSNSSELAHYLNGTKRNSLSTKIGGTLTIYRGKVTAFEIILQSKKSPKMINTFLSAVAASVDNMMRFIFVKADSVLLSYNGYEPEPAIDVVRTVRLAKVTDSDTLGESQHEQIHISCTLLQEVVNFGVIGGATSRFYSLVGVIVNIISNFRDFSQTFQLPAICNENFANSCTSLQHIELCSLYTDCSIAQSVYSLHGLLDDVLPESSIHTCQDLLSGDSIEKVTLDHPIWKYYNERLNLQYPVGAPFIQVVAFSSQVSGCTDAQTWRKPDFNSI